MENTGEKCCPNRSEDIQKVEPQNLLEESWFFGNLLNNTTSSRTKMSRCHSEPSRSSNSKCGEGTVDRSDERSSFSSTKLGRTPSLPIGYVGRPLEFNQEKEILDFSEGRKITVGSSSAQKSLIRAPSLPPPCVVKEEEDDEEEEDQESEFTLGRLIRQASLNSKEILPTRQTSKSSRIPMKYRLRNKETEGNKEMGQQLQMNPKKMVQRTSNLHPKVAQDDLEALRSEFEKGSFIVDDNSNKVSGFPNMAREKLRRSTSLLDASFYLKKSSAPSTPSWASTATDGYKSTQDMKDQIKFWARAVASNAKAPGVLITNQN